MCRDSVRIFRESCIFLLLLAVGVGIDGFAYVEFGSLRGFCGGVVFLVGMGVLLHVSALGEYVCVPGGTSLGVRGRSYSLGVSAAG